MKSFSLVVLVASIAFITGAGLTYVATTPWSSDMANQPSIKPQEGPMLPPQGSVTTNLISGSGLAVENRPEQAGTGHQHAGGEAAGHDHGSAAGKHDHAAKDKSQGMSHQHGSGGMADHKHGDSGQHDHGSKNMSAGNGSPSQPIPKDLMGSAGTGPGKTIPQAKGNARNSAPAKAAPHDHSSHSHTGGADHQHGPAGESPAKQKMEKTKAKVSSATHQHGANETPGHSHAGADGHAHGPEMQSSQVKNPIKPTAVSVKMGHKLFGVYCAVCHGDEGRGGAPMANKLQGIPKFTAELLRSVDDAHMFSMVTSGHGPMPGYAEALSPEERWHVANYVNTLQKKLASEQSSAGASR